MDATRLQGLINLFHFSDGILDTVFLALRYIALPHLSTFFRMFNPIIHLSNKVIDIARFEKRTFVQCKVRRSAFRGIRYNGNKAAAERLHASDGFDFGIGSMDIYIRGINNLEQILRTVEIERSRVRKPLAHLLVFFKKRALTSKHKLDFVAMCDILPEVMAAKSQKFGLEDVKQYTDYKEMLEKEKPELASR